MAEQMKSISEARQNLPNLSLNAQQRMERYVITNQGKPQSVLVGYDDYQKMRAATEILLDPRARGSLRRGLAEQQAGQRLTAEQVRERLRNKKTVIAGEGQIAATLPDCSNIPELSSERRPAADLWDAFMESAAPAKGRKNAPKAPTGEAPVAYQEGETLENEG